ncbi:MAG: hypothetical protein KGL39_11790 [Patescibacteria group bacterium]|nr:hypothetical protein [Patescibacteria group bacterium]
MQKPKRYEITLHQDTQEFIKKRKAQLGMTTAGYFKHLIALDMAKTVNKSMAYKKPKKENPFADLSLPLPEQGDYLGHQEHRHPPGNDEVVGCYIWAYDRLEKRIAWVSENLICYEPERYIISE